MTRAWRSRRGALPAPAEATTSRHHGRRILLEKPPHRARPRREGEGDHRLRGGEGEERLGEGEARARGGEGATSYQASGEGVGRGVGDVRGNPSS
jgi:hypothetical protein